MIERIIQWSLERRVVVLLLAVALFIYGIFAGSKLPIDVLPDLNRPTVTVLTELHGAGAEEVETQLTAPLESSLNGLPGVTRLRSVSTQGLSLIWVEFDWDSDIFRNRQVVTERLQQVATLLPQTAVPALGPISSIMGEIMLIGLVGEESSSIELRTIADTVLKPRLLALPGVSVVSVIGGDKRQYQVSTRIATLLSSGVTIEEIREAIQRANRPAEGGVLPLAHQEVIYRAFGQVAGERELASIAVLRDAGGSREIVPLREISTVQIAGDPAKRGDAGMNGEPGVVISIQKQPQADTLKLTKLVDQELSAIEASLKDGVRIEKGLFRQADFINRSVDNVVHAIVVGAVLIVVVLLAFLANLRTTVITLVTIPLSLAISVIVFQLLGASINTMTLGGLAIAIGELVDDAIVDVENVFRRLKENSKAISPRPTILVIFEASREIRNSIVIATLIVITVFIPLFFLVGIEGRIFAPLGMAYIVSILISLLVAITVTPVLCSYLLTTAKDKHSAQETALVRWFKGIHLRLLYWIERWFKQACWGVAITFVIAIFLAWHSGREFLPKFNEGSLTINALLPPEASLSESSRIGASIERALLQIPEVLSTGRRTGRADLDEHAQGVNSSEIETNLRPDGRPPLVVMGEIRELLSRFPGVQIDVGQPISHRIDHLLSGVEAQIVVKIFGPDLLALRELGERVAELGRTTQGLVDVRVEQQLQIPQMHLQPNYPAMATYGVEKDALMQTFATAIGSEPITQIIERGHRVDVRLFIPELTQSFGDHVSMLPVRASDGNVIRLGDLVSFESAKGPNLISRDNGSRRIGVYANVGEIDLGAAVTKWRQTIDANIDLPAGYSIRFEGQLESQKSASRLIWMLGAAAVVAVGLLLFGHYRGWWLVLQIMLSVPFAAIGGLLAVIFTTDVFSIATLVGLITVTGIATRNGVMMIDHIIHLTAIEGAPKSEATIYRAAQERLVPVLMTALTAILALVPILVAPHEPGREILYPVAVVLFGGLLSGTVLNLLLTPTIFSRLAHRVGWGDIKR